jgi:GNAT superfamily N-acetyltransferase
VSPTRLKLLIDTNVIIPLDPTSPGDLHDNTQVATELQNLAYEVHAQLWVHPAASKDLSRDPDPVRRDLRERLIRKYLSLSNPPPDAAVTAVVGAATSDHNDWVDNQLLAALHADAVDYLITEDRRIFRKARTLGVEHRVFTIAAAIAHLRSLFDRAPVPPPAVRSAKAYELNIQDPIFDSFREDYGSDSFNSWLQKCRREHRQTWIVDAAGHHAAFAIVNEEAEAPEPRTRTLKVCSFKVSPNFRGFRYGELLLKAIFGYAEDNRYGAVFVTAFPHHDELIALFEDFGFIRSPDLLPTGEYKLTKSMTVTTEVLSPLAFNIRFGPRAVSLSGAAVYIVPIQPQYSDYLFPETAASAPLFAGRFPFGNGIRKAYLCNAGIRVIRPGDLLAFYRSQLDQAIIATGVVEQTLVSDSPEQIARTVGKRTVYRYAEIEQLCARGEVLTLLFRQSRILQPSISLADLVGYGAMPTAPQSIRRVGEDGAAWLSNRIAG